MAASARTLHCSVGSGGNAEQSMQMSPTLLGVIGSLGQVLLQEFLKTRLLDDGLIEQRIGAGGVGADADQVARALVARIELLEVADLARDDQAGIRLTMAREIDCSISMAG